MKRRILSLFLTLALVLGLLPVGTLAAKGSSDFIARFQQQTTVPAGYTAIQTAADLAGIAGNLSGKYILMADVKLSGAWIPIGSKSSPFVGTLNGNGYTISGLQISQYVSETDQMDLGLFGYMSGATVENLMLSGQVTADVTETFRKKSGHLYLGGIAGQAIDSTIQNCITDVKVSDNDLYHNYNHAMGGTAGYAERSNIQYCLNLNAMYSRAKACGGLVGQTDHCTFYACRNDGTINGGLYSGGIAGDCEATQFSSCANTADLFMGDLSGGIAGCAYEGSSLSDCLNTGTIKLWEAGGGVPTTSGIVGGRGFQDEDPQVRRCVNVGTVPRFAAVTTSYTPDVAATYWLDTSSNYMCFAFGNDGEDKTTGKLTAQQMKDPKSFPEFSFPDKWTLTEGMDYPIPTPLVVSEFVNTYLLTYTDITEESLSGGRYSTIMMNSGSGSLAGQLGRAYSDAHLRGANALWGGIDYLNDCLSFKGYQITNDFEVILADIFSNAVNSQEFQQILSDNILENFSEAVTELNFAYDVTTSQLLQNKLAALAKLDTVYSAKAAAEMREVQNLVKDGITHNSIPQGFAVVGSVVNLVGDTMSSAEAAMAEIDRFVLCNAYVDAVEEYGQVLLDTADQSLSISDQVLDGVNLRAAVYDFVDKMNDYARENYTTLFAACGGNLMDAATSAMSSTVDIIYWNMADLCPVLAGIKTGFAMGQLVGDGPTNMDGIHYYGKMLDMAGYMAQAMFKVVQNRQDALAETGEYPEAAALNAATDLYLSLQVLACDYAIGYCDAIYTAFLTQVMPDLFKINDEELVSSIQILSQKAALLDLQKNGKNITVGPDGSIHGFIAQCPVTVIVETKDGTEIARLSTGEKTVNDQYDDVFTLMGENMEMKCGFYDPTKHNIRIEGDGSGTMDLTLFTSNNGTLTSRQTYLDLPVSKGDVFTPGTGNVVKNGSETIQPDASLIPNPFTDIKESDWFYPYVMELYSKNIVSGMTATTFAPKGQLTWGQALKLLLVGTGVMEDAKVTGADWAAPYVNKAIELGAISSADPNKAITRLEFCTVAAKIAGLEPTPAQGFTDCTDPYVGALVEAGVINGYAQDDGTFRFDGGKTLIRSEISKVISLLIAIQ